VVIEFFGEIMTSGNIIVGLVIFAILVIIQFVVITKGAQRVAEVGARFTLDAMPGKQMAIDADLNAGLITEEDARIRRQKIADEADFYGAMDGASKFVRGDAIAGIIITLINIVGGFGVGYFQNLEFSEIFRIFTTLTIGDGLVTQIPALLVASAAGIIVTRTTSQSNLGEDLSRQVFNYPKAMALASSILAFLAVSGLFTPFKLIFIPFMTVAALMFVLSRRLENAKLESVKVKKAREAEKAEKEHAPERVESLLQVDQMELLIGYGIIPLVDASQGGDLLDRVTVLRRQIATDLGLIVPPIRIRDNMQLKPNSYSVKIRGGEVASGEVLVEYMLAMNPSEGAKKLEGIQTTDPSFGLPAVWIRPETKERALSLGYAVIEPAAVLATHLSETVKNHAHEILTRQDVKSLIDNLKETNTVVVDELIPNTMSLGQVQKVLQNLLKERVSIRDLATICEALADAAPSTKDLQILTEYVRQALNRSICQQNMEADGKLYVITLDPAVEQTLASSLVQTETGAAMALEPQTAAVLIQEILKGIQTAAEKGHPPILLTSPQVRPHLKRLTEQRLPNLVIISYNEIATGVPVESMGTVKMP
jgi:flagellar biosynthesis protein FlhA